MKLLQEHEIDLNKKYVIHTTGRYELYYGYKSIRGVFIYIPASSTFEELKHMLKHFELTIKVEGDTVTMKSGKLTDLLNIYDFETEDEKREYLLLEELKK